MPNNSFDPDMRVQDVLQQYPQTVPVFLRLKLGCIGCDLAAFCTLRDISDSYTIDLSDLLRQLDETLSS